MKQGKGWAGAIVSREHPPVAKARSCCPGRAGCSGPPPPAELSIPHPRGTVRCVVRSALCTVYVALCAACVAQRGARSHRASSCSRGFSSLPAGTKRVTKATRVPACHPQVPYLLPAGTKSLCRAGGAHPVKHISHPPCRGAERWLSAGSHPWGQGR